MKIADLRNKTVSELGNLLKEIRTEQVKMRFQIAAKQLTKHHLVRNARLTVARIKTLVRAAEGDKV
jgi:ribosomal protein L29